MASSFTILFVNLPPKTFIGIDLVSFTSSPNFHGINQISPGLHFIYTGTDASLSIRHGRWLHLSPSSAVSSSASIQTLKWNTEDESLTLDTSADVQSLPHGLVDYSALTAATSDILDKQALSTVSPTDFPVLTSHITPALLNRILRSGISNPETEAETSEWRLSSISSAPRDTEVEHIPGLTESEVKEVVPDDASLNVLDVDLKRTWDEGDVGRVRTDRARDRSWYLGHLIEIAGDTPITADPRLATAAPATATTTTSTTTNPFRRELGAKSLLGELQLTFLTVLTLSNYSCLEQWKRLLTVLLTCQTALTEVPAYFIEVLRILELQLRHADDVEGGLFELRDEVGSAWLRGLVGRFAEIVKEVDVSDKQEDEGVGGLGGLTKEMKRFEDGMRERFGWEEKGAVLRRGMLELEDGERVEITLDGADEDEERGEWAPVVVET